MKLPEFARFEKIIIVVICLILAMVLIVAMGLKLMSSTTVADYMDDEYAKEEAYNTIHNILDK